jgi:hypothetical protein
MTKEVKFCPLCNKEYTPPICQPCTDEFCKPINIKNKTKMKAEEKAKDLIKKFLPLVDDGGYYDDVCYNVGDDTGANAKQCALIAVDEIIKSQPFDIYNMEQCKNVNEYWQEVKTEIEKL